MAVLTRTLDEQLAALLRGDAFECLVCGEEVEVVGEHVECQGCGSIIERGREEAAAQSSLPLF